MTHNARWSDEEIQFLKLNYGSMKPQKIADVLGRTVISVKSQAYTLGYAKKKLKAIDGKKQCSKCNQIKTIADFYTHKSSSDGLYSWCRVCTQVSRKEKYFQKKLKEQDQEKIDFISSVKDQLFKCNKCLKEMTIDNFGIYRRNTTKKLTVRPNCTKCKNRIDRDRRLERERRNEYAEPTNRA